MKTVLPMAAAMVLALGWAGQARAHCEIPCGIYGDSLRFQLLAEHITTIEKSMKEIRALAAKKGKQAQDLNQLNRWVANKEAHASKLQEIVSQYFLHQRIKPAPASQAKAHKRYLAQLTAAHSLLIGAMKAKQTVDLGMVAKLRKDLAAFEAAYGGK